MKIRLYAILFFALLLTTCNKYYTPTKATTENLRVRSDQPKEPADHPLDAIIDPYKSALDEQMTRIIGRASKRLFKERPESTLGNWVADAVQSQAMLISNQPVDASLQNYGGIRIPEVTEGDISVGKIYELMPFDNMLVIVEMSGRMTQRFFDHTAADGGWPVSKEVQYILQQEQAKQLRIGGEAIQMDKTYRIALPDYIANGGGNCDFLRDLPRENTGHLVRDLLIAEVEAQTGDGKTIEANIEGRVRFGD